MIARRFEVFIVGLEPTRGAEMKKIRPCVVVSPEPMNRHLQTVLVAPLTSAARRYPSRVPCKFEGLTGEVALDQLRSVDRSRLGRSLGFMSESEGRAIALTLQEMFA